MPRHHCSFASPNLKDLITQWAPIKLNWKAAATCTHKQQTLVKGTKFSVN